MTDKALIRLMRLPRVNLYNVKPLPGSVRPRWWGHDFKDRGVVRTRKYASSGMAEHQAHLPIGTFKRKTPFYIAMPREVNYADDWVTRRPLLPVSLLQLQRALELGRLDPSRPVDLAALCATGLFKIRAFKDRVFGIMLTDDEGLDEFNYPVVLEVQHASEPAIAAIERVGGKITTRFFDLACVDAAECPRTFFLHGLPVPRCKLPPRQAVAQYTDPRQRGYLADQKEVQEAKEELAQKYGYELPASPKPGDSLYSAWRATKHPRQVFYGLQPGWVVNLADKVVLKPKDKQITDYYGTRDESPATAENVS